MIRFLGTKIGASILVAVLIIGAATAVKIKGVSDKRADLSSKVGLIAAESIQNAIKYGQTDSESWENTLRALTSSSTDEKIANLSGMAAANGETAENLTATDQFARDFLAKYVELKQSGGKIDDGAQQRIIDDLLLGDYSGFSAQKEYTDADILISDSNSVADIKAYGNNLGRALNVAIPRGMEQELAVLNQVNSGGSPELLKKLSVNQERYEGIRDNLLAIRAPKAIKNIHLALVNAAAHLADAVEGMMSINTDPVGSIAKVSRYEESVTLMDISITALQSYFKSRGVSYSQSESGYVLLQ